MNKRKWIIIAAAVLGVVIITLVVVTWVGGREVSAIQGKTWEWVSMVEYSPNAQSIVPNPSSYTITFNKDGTFTGQADCNQFSGDYTMANGELSLSPGPSTLAECGPDSLYIMFQSNLAIADGYSLSGNELTITFGDGAGEMVFNAQ